MEIEEGAERVEPKPIKDAADLYLKSARNRLRGTVSEVRVEGLLAQVELTVTEPARVVAVVTRDAVEELGLKPGMAATAVVKSTSVMVEA